MCQPQKPYLSQASANSAQNSEVNIAEIFNSMMFVLYLCAGHSSHFSSRGAAASSPEDNCAECSRRGGDHSPVYARCPMQKIKEKIGQHSTAENNRARGSKREVDQSLMCDRCQLQKMKGSGLVHIRLQKTAFLGAA